eukprot:PITA_09991
MEDLLVDKDQWIAVDSGDDWKARIIGGGKIKLKLQGGRVRTLLGVLYIPALARNLITISKLDDVGVKTVFKKDTCKMVRGALVLMRGVRIGTLYKLQGRTIINGCKNSVVPESGAENLVVSGEKTMLWHQGLGHIGEKGLQILHGKDMVKDVIKHEVQPKEHEKIDFELKEKESDSTAEEELEDERPQTPSERRSVQERRHPEEYCPYAFCSNFCLSIIDDDPITMKKAVDSKYGKLWKEAMVDEMESLYKNEAWDLVELLARRKPISRKWVFKKKTNAERMVEK